MEGWIGMNLANVTLDKWWKILQGEGLGLGRRMVFKQIVMVCMALLIWKQRNEVAFQKILTSADEQVTERRGLHCKGGEDRIDNVTPFKVVEGTRLHRDGLKSDYKRERNNLVSSLYEAEFLCNDGE